MPFRQLVLGFRPNIRGTKCSVREEIHEEQSVLVRVDELSLSEATLIEGISDSNDRGGHYLRCLRLRGCGMHLDKRSDLKYLGTSCY